MSTEQCITIVQAHKLACRIYVGSLNYDLRPADMKQLFSTVGPVTMVDMNVDYATGRNKVNSNARACLLALRCADAGKKMCEHQGFCFVAFDSQETTNRAIAVLDGIEVAGRAT